MGHSEVIYKVYPKRWVILLGCMLLVNFSHGVWLTFTPVAYKCAEWMGGKYAEDPSILNIYGAITFPVSFVSGIIGAYVFDKYGAYLPLMVGGWSLSITSAIRVAAAYIDDSDTRHIMFIVAQAGTGLSLSMLSLSPTKIANVWFGEKERQLANSLVTLQLPAGILFAYVIGPQLVNAFGDDLDGAFQALMWFYFAPCLLGTLCITFTLDRTGKPEIPPSPAGDEEDLLPFFTGLWQLITNKMYLMIVGVIAVGMGYLSILMISFPVIMCPFGYSDLYSNTLAITILIGTGVTSTLIWSVVIDKYGRAEIFAKVFAVLALIGIVMLNFFATMVDQYVLLSVSLSIAGIFMYPILPICYELAVESTYPVGPATSAGLNWVVSSLFSFLMELIWVPLKTTKGLPEENINACVSDSAEGVNNFSARSILMGLTEDGDEDDEVKDWNYRNSMLTLSGILTFTGIWFIVFFRCPYKRRDWQKDQNQAQGESNEGVVE